MNITTIGNTNSLNWKRFKGTSIAAAAGLTLAGSAVIAGVGSGTSSSKPIMPAHQASVPAISRTADTIERANYVTLQEQFLVGQLPVQRQASDADIAASVLSTGMANFAAPAHTVPAQGMPSADIATERAELVTLLEQQLVAERSGVPMRQVADADISASVLSTELANFAVPAQRVVAESDILAGALSSELAHSGN